MKFKMSNEPLSIFAYSSLTDIVMLLLIFFLLTSQFVIQTGVKVKLPGSKTNEQSVPSKLVVTIAPGGTVFVLNEEIGMNQLTAKLESIKKNITDENLIINADKTVTIDIIIKVIDAAKSAGIDKFTLQTEREML
ncbi:MAG: biopolymer transporter ExbD [Ignavibacteriaceae bacterium]|nr:biopolymer transporter ExbD [Ignavibacteriaceae bacterium]